MKYRNTIFVYGMVSLIFMSCATIEKPFVKPQINTTKYSIDDISRSWDKPFKNKSMILKSYDSYEAIKLVFGEPNNVTETPFKNKYLENVTDEIYRIEYSGYIIKYYHLQSKNTYLPILVEFNRNSEISSEFDFFNENLDAIQKLGLSKDSITENDNYILVVFSIDKQMGLVVDKYGIIKQVVINYYLE